MSTTQLVEHHDFYVYAYLDPRKPGKFTYNSISFLYEPFYIGKGRGSRMLAHLQPKRLQETDSQKNRKIKKLLEANTPPITIKLVQGLQEKEALTKEKQLIKDIGRHDLGLGPLTNLDDGGREGGNFSEERREALAASKRGKKLSPEHAKALRDSHTGVKQSEETKKKRLESRRETGYTKSPESLAKWRASRDATIKRKQEENGGKFFTHSEEHKKHMSELQKGKKQDPEAIRKGVETRKKNGSYKGFSKEAHAKSVETRRRNKLLKEELAKQSNN